MGKLCDYWEIIVIHKQVVVAMNTVLALNKEAILWRISLKENVLCG